MARPRHRPGRQVSGEAPHSPNDVVQKSNATSLTDPPTGFPSWTTIRKKELDFNGVYRLSDGKLHLLYKGISASQRLAFSPDEKYFYLNNSEPEPRKSACRFEVGAYGSLANGKVFFRCHQRYERGRAGRNENRSGSNVYSTGQSGVWILRRRATPGYDQPPKFRPIYTGAAPDARTLYITARNGVCIGLTEYYRDPAVT